MKKYAELGETYTLDSGVPVREVRRQGSSANPVTLVMHPGIGGTIDDFNPIIPRLNAERIIVVDTARARRLGEFSSHRNPLLPLPGFDNRFPTIDTYTDIYSEVLEKLVPSDTPWVLGFSWAGVLTQAYILRHPERVAGAVLVATVPGEPHQLPTPSAAVAAQSLMMPNRSADWLRRYGPQMYGGVDQEGRDLRDHPDSLLGTAAEREIDTTAYAKQQDIAYTLSAQLALHSLHARLPYITTDTLIMNGEADPLVPVSNARELHRLLGRSVLTVIPRAGHLLLSFQAESAATHINAFCAGELSDELARNGQTRLLRLSGIAA